jgi:putative toxin-antitoxin system antitoxin component (TIGR02293 family)
MRRHGDTVVEGFLPLQPSLSGRVQEASTSCARPLVERIRTGLPMAEFQQLQDLFDIPEEDLGRFLGLSPATLHRRKKSGSLTASESERIVRFARLFGITMAVFETEAGAREWLKTPNPGTAHEAPLSYADTEFGAREVENLLGRIDHGVF